MVWLACCPAHAQEVPEDARQAVDDAAELKRDGQLVEAESRLGDALMAAPAYGEAWWLNGWVQTGLQDNPAALLAFRKAARLLPEGDPRIAQATAKADALEAAGATLPKPAAKPASTAPLPSAPMRPAPERIGNPLAGWPAALLLLAAGIACGAAWLALRSDAQHGPLSPHARFAQFARRLARGDIVAANPVLKLILNPALADLPEDDRIAVLAAAAKSHEPSRATLAAMVIGPPGPAQRAAALATAQQDEQPSPELWTSLLSSDDAALRRAALRGLGRQPDPSALTLLTDLAQSRDAGEADLAVAALVRLGGEPAFLALAALPTTTAGPGASAAALAALAGKRRLPAALAEPLAKLLDSDFSLDRVVVTQALAGTGDAGLPRLLEALLDTEPAVRSAVATLLGKRDVPAEPAKAWARQLADQPARATVEALRWLSDAVPSASGAVLERVLQSEQVAAAMRLEAVTLLAAHPSEAADDVLRRAFRRLAPAPHPDDDVQALAEALADALAARRVLDALPPLLEWAGLQPARPRWLRAARQLAAQPEAGPVLAEALAQPAGKIRRLAVSLLADYPHPAAADALLSELSRAGSGQTAADVLHDAAEALGALDEQRALAPLRTLLERHPELACDRLDIALAQLGDEAARSRVEAMLLRPEPAERRAAAAYFRTLQPVPPRAAGVVAEADAHAAATALLAEAADPVPGLVALGEPVLPTLHACLAESAHRLEAAAALAQLGQPQALERARLLDRIDLLAGADDPVDGELRSLLDADPSAADYARARLGEERWQAWSAANEPS